MPPAEPAGPGFSSCGCCSPAHLPLPLPPFPERSLRTWILTLWRLQQEGGGLDKALQHLTISLNAALVPAGCLTDTSSVVSHSLSLLVCLPSLTHSGKRGKMRCHSSQFPPLAFPPTCPCLLPSLWWSQLLQTNKHCVIAQHPSAETKPKRFPHTSPALWGTTSARGCHQSWGPPMNLELLGTDVLLSETQPVSLTHLSQELGWMQARLRGGGEGGNS